MSQTNLLSTNAPQVADPGQTTRAVPKQKRRKQSLVSAELAYGQGIIVTTRWILVASGLLLTLWNAGELSHLRWQVSVVFLLALVNFYLQAQNLMRRPLMKQVVYAASLFDFVVITLLVWMQGGFDSQIYVFYFPAILAMSVAFNTAVTIGFISSIAAVYTMFSLSSVVAAEGNLQLLIARLLMLVAVAFCGNLYWRIERDRRHTIRKAGEELVAEVRRRKNNSPNAPKQEVNYANAS